LAHAANPITVTAVNAHHGEPAPPPIDDPSAAGQPQPPYPGAQFGQPWPDSAPRAAFQPPKPRRGAWGWFKLLLGLGIVLAFAGGVFYTHVIDPDRDDAGHVRGDRSIAVTDVRAGDCTSLNPFLSLVGDLDVTPCSNAHNAEVIGRHTMPKGNWPGADAVDQAAKTECSSRFQAYTGTAAGTGDVDTVFATPTESTWSRDRDIVCFAYKSGGGLTSTLRH
jgi:hypothetical protein